MTLNRLVRAAVVAGLASALVYGVLIFASDWRDVSEALRTFDPLVFLGFLGLATGCYFIRALRWRGLMRRVGYPTPASDAIYLHLAGQTMSITPGRVGEVFKPWLARDVAGMPMGRGVALVFSERVADLLAVSLLSLGGLSALGSGTWGLLAALAALFVGTWVAGSPWFHTLALRFLCERGWGRKHSETISSIAETIRDTLSWRTLSWSVPASVLAWGLEGVGFALCLRELGFEGASVAVAISVYAVSTIVGAFTFLPGGIGLTEASMAGILIALGMGAADASAATLITRVATLWWGVALGWVALATRPATLSAVLRSEAE